MSLNMDNLPKEGKVRTDLECTECSKVFYAILDYDVDGNNEINCPYCGHIHYRLIVKGKVTSSRYNSDYGTRRPTAESVWNSSTIPAQTKTSARYIRDKFLDGDK